MTNHVQQQEAALTEYNENIHYSLHVAMQSQNTVPVSVFPKMLNYFLTFDNRIFTVGQ